MEETGPDSEAAGRNPTLLAVAAHLAVLWSCAIVKPLFDVLADSPEFFVARGNTPADVVVFALAVTVVPPAVLLGVELALGRLPTVRRLVHLAFVAALTAAIAMQIAKDALDADSMLALAGSLLVGAAFAFAYDRGAPVRATLTVLAPLPIVFVLLFLFSSPVSDVVFPGDARASAVRVNGRPTTPILFVVFDEFSGESLMDRRHRVDPTRYPNFARLARDATWYRNATTVADFTTEAVPAILTGQRPKKDQLPTVGDHPDNLFTSLRGRYSFNVEEPVTHLCPEDLCAKEGRDAAPRRLWDLAHDLTIVQLHRLAPKSVERHLPPVDQTFSGFGGGARQADAGQTTLDTRSESFDRFVGRLGRESRKPTLDFLHIEFPHIPWQYLPSGQRYSSSGSTPGLPTNLWTPDIRLVRRAQRRYLLQTGYADRLLGRILERARSTGLYDRALVIVTADHGVAFRPSTHRRAIGPKTFPEIAGVPLFIKAPGQPRGHASDAPAIATDIFPTLASYTGLALPRSDGVSLRATPNPARSELSVYEIYGDPVVLPFARFTQRRDRAIDALAAMFGEDDAWRGLFAPPRYAKLVGTRIADHERGRPVDARVTLDTPSAFRDVDARLSVPAMIGGRLTGSVATGQPLALAVNGRIAGIAEALDVGGELRFDALLQAAPFRSGENDFQALAIDASGPSVRLAGIEGGNQDVRLANTGGHQSIAGVRPDPLPVVKGEDVGFLETVQEGATGLNLSGWAASRTTAASRILIFAGGTLIGDAEPSQERPDVAKGRSPETLKCGYTIEAILPQDASDDDIRAFAVIGDKAFELPRL